MRLRPALTGATIVAVSGSHEEVARHRSRLVGRGIAEVTAHGKHLLIHVERGWTVRTHMGMTGRWALYSPGERWRQTPGKARIVIESEDAVAVCFAVPHVEIGPTARVMERLERIGPDLIGEHVPYELIVAAALRHLGPTVADVVLDQAVAAGIGNVFKSEVLYLERISPHISPEMLAAEDMERLYARAVRLLTAGVGTSRRSTTGSRRPNQEYWVYGRAGSPCRRCGATIKTDRHGELDRTTYWCPRCQPAPEDETPPSERKTSNG